MEILPARNSLPGITLYYLNTAAFMFFAVMAWNFQHAGYLTGAVIALTALLLQDILWLRRTRFDPNDKYLIEKLKRRFDHDDTRELLTEIDFRQQPYHLIHHLIKLEEIMKWDGADFAFKNKHCQRAWTGIREHLQALLDLLYQHGKQENAYVHYISYTAQPDYQGEDYAAQANQHTQAIWHHYQQLRRIYIQKMPYE